MIKLRVYGVGFRMLCSRSKVIHSLSGEFSCVRLKIQDQPLRARFPDVVAVVFLMSYKVGFPTFDPKFKISYSQMLFRRCHDRI